MSDIRKMQKDVVLVTGPSGAGRSTAIRVLEDLGFEAIDNLPLGLVKDVVRHVGPAAPLAIGVDVRTRGFSASNLIDIVDWLVEAEHVRGQLLYLDCAPDVLLRRFSETRRRHPLADVPSPEQAIAAELDLLIPLRGRADILIDTSDLSPHDLKSHIGAWFVPESDAGLSISLESFSYKRGLPRGLDMVLDCRFLRNPHWDEMLRPLTGRDAAVGEYISGDPRYAAFLEQTFSLLDLLIPAYREEGKAYFGLGFGCTGGRHRSVWMCETVAKRLAERDIRVSIRHRELERRGT
ncbi:RNase adapter RapZ [Pontivivens ytuae]|uniref:RNase adapter RapZ n=1 Tax=Pontivivens ytuae TaxID=2789856 RepID=A0A7S9QDQ7_9RHOB|nr:RNase adapter RapZ [Pontivivens ytuae]QPH54411.1 RNase adapter RapZ [Pontivivens ytuae]